MFRPIFQRSSTAATGLLRPTSTTVVTDLTRASLKSLPPISSCLRLSLSTSSSSHLSFSCGSASQFPGVPKIVGLTSQRNVSSENTTNEKKLNEEIKSSGEDPEELKEVAEEEPETKSKSRKTAAEPVARHLDKDRTKVIPVEVSMRYLKSAAYLQAYGTDPVWVRYRRNFPGQFPPKLTRRNCVKHGKLWTGNPCPICRDTYLVVHEENVELLKQFVSPFNGEILSYEKTNVCRFQHAKLILAIEKAKDLGLFTFDVPFREYDYQEYAGNYQR